MKIFTQIGLIFTLLLFGSINSNAQKLVETFEEENIFGNNAFGENLSGIGDINGDGYDDFMVVARFYNDGKGRAYIYLGGNTVSSDANYTLGGNDADEDIFGGSGVGDINNDGYDDLILQGVDSERNITRLYIYLGGASFDTYVDLNFTGPYTYDDLMGDVSAAGDVNNDGYDDFVVIGKRSTDALAFIYYGAATPDTEADLVVEFGGTMSAIQDVAYAGDVNNDGFDDIIIGDYDFGRMSILYGGSPMDDVVDVRVDYGSGNTRFGCSVAGVGDVNKDGYDDVLVGARGYEKKGAAYLYFGGENMDNLYDKVLYGNDDKGSFGQTVSGTDINNDGYSDIIITDIRYYVESSNGDIKIYYGGETINNSPDAVISPWGVDDSGQTLSSSGDINNDGYNDIVIGDEYNNATYIYYGGASFDTDVDVTLYGEGEDNYTGGSVSSAGDVNGDGYDDVIVGAAGYNRNSGRAYIYFGGPDADNVADVIMEERGKNTWFGFSVSCAGDVNNDGYDDVIVGEKGYSGKAYIYYGGSSMDNVADVTLAEVSSSNFGFSVSGAGDVNQDGYDDVIVGDNGYSPTGRAFIYFGGSAMDNLVDVTLIGEANGIEFGTSVSAAGDVNNDGYADVIVGANRYNSDTGRAYIYYGGASMDDGIDLTLTGEAVSNFFGESVSGVGDVNKDGFDDVLVGANGYNSDVGRAYIYLGGSSMDNESDLVLSGDASSKYFGGSVAGLGDINKDGYDDVIIGRHLYKTYVGAVHIYYGGENMNDVSDIILRGEADNDSFGGSISGGGDFNNDGATNMIVGADLTSLNGKAYCFSFVSTPVIETNAATGLAAYSVTANGFIVGVGSSIPIAHGFCWSTSSNPSILNSKVDLGAANGAGKYSSNIADLLPNTNYYIRAFATNNTETVYGEEQSFTTPKADQVISFDALNTVSYGDASFSLTATASSGLAVSYTSSDPTVASLTGNKVTILGSGTTTITASQEGNTTYNAAPQVQQVLTVNKASLTITADDKSKIYGAENPALSFRYSGFVNGEDATTLTSQPSVHTTADASTGVGSVPITLSGAAANNYSFNYVNGTLNINKAELTVTADDKTKNYGDANPVFTFRYFGFVNGEDETVLNTAPIATSIADAFTDVGTATILVSGGIDDNYTFRYVNGTLNINKTELTVRGDDKFKTYGENNPSLTLNYAGFVNGENATALTTAPTAQCSADATTGVGGYLITVSGGVDDNYSFKYLNGTLNIDKAELTLIADDKSKTYGEPNPILTLSYSGFVNGDDASDLSTEPTANSSADAFTAVGSVPITISEGVANNYSLSYVNGILSINKAELTVTADDKSKTYGDENPAFTVSYSGFVNGEGEANLDSAPTAYSSADAYTGVGSVPITLSEGVANNYSFKYVNGTLSINKAKLIVKADNRSKNYGDANPELTVSYTGFMYGEDATDLKTTPTAQCSADVTTGVGSYLITVSGGIANNYSLSYVNGTLSINKAELTVTAQNKSKTYGDINPAFTIGYTGFVNGDDVSVLTSEPTASSIANENTGVGSVPITVSGGFANNYSFNYVDGTLSINKAELTATADDKIKIYGDVNPDFTVSYTGFVNGDNALVLTTAPKAFSTAGVTTGAGSAIITVSGGEDENYSFNYVNGTLDINKAVLKVKANDKTKTYGESNPVFTQSYSGFVNGEDVSALTSEPTANTIADENTGAGSTDITISGGIADNYSFNYVNGTLSINKAELTVTAQNKSKTYGDANPAFTLTYTGFVNGEDVSALTSEPTASSIADENTGAGVTDITISGGIADNYNFNYVNGTLNITKAALTVTADDKIKIYGDVNPAFTLNYNGFVNGDNASILETAPKAFSTAGVTTGAGSAIITVSGGEDENYSFNYVNGTLDINKVVLKVKANDKTKTYGEINPVFTLSYSGFVNGEDVSALTTEPTANTIADENTGAGVTDITISGGIADNYSFNYVNGTLSISKAELTVTAQNKSKTYGDVNPAFVISYTGFVNGDDVSVLTSEPTASSIADENTGVGSVPITVSGGSTDNYSFKYVDGTLSINKAELTAIADDKSKNYGEVNPAFTLTYTGFVNGEDVSALTTEPTANTIADENTGAGATDITISGGIADNYNFNYVNGTLNITKAALTITADDKTRFYGQANPEFTASYAGFVNGDNAQSLTKEPTLTTLADASTVPGTAAIVVSDAQSDNYTFSYMNGALSINKAELTVTAQNKSKTYGDANPAFAIGYTGFVNGDDVSVLTSEPTVNTIADENTGAGATDITISGGIADNYNFNYVNGTLNITKAALTITADDKTRFYGQANPEFTASYAGFVNGDNAQSLTKEPTLTTLADASTVSGTAAIVVSDAQSDNYTFSYVNGTLSINKAELTVTAQNKSKTYGDANPAFAIGYAGFVNGDDVSVLTSEPTASSIADKNTGVSSVPITVSGGFSDNYSFKYVDGTLSINKAILNVSTDDITRNYGESNPEFNLKYIGFVNGDDVSALSQEPIATCAANSTTEVSGVKIIISGGAADNYKFNYENGMLLVNPAELYVSVDNITRAYGEVNPEFTLSYTGFLNGDEESVLDTKPTCSTDANLHTGIGNVDIIVTGGSDNNYNFNYSKGTLTINKAELTVSADDKFKTYGEANPDLSISYNGFVNDEDVNALTTQPTVTTIADQTTNAGTKEITVSGGEADNYSFKYMSATLTINKAELTVSADNKSREQGAENPELTLSFNGFVNGDNESDIDVLPAATCEADENSIPGEYDIIIDSGEDNNYEFSYVNGVLTVRLVTGITDLELTELVAYPNPGKEWLAIKWTSNNTYKAEIQILSMNGSLVKTIKDYNKGSKINISELRPGTYMLRIKIEDTYQIKKIIKV